ncbi:MAG: DUF58 domain-containing protein [Lachnospiraceae bacterium]|nr:DUF58 domain-containing protein [Lachnospiraceae bacterium]
MKAFVFLGLATVTLYLAGIYRSEIVMAAAVIEFLLWVIMAVFAYLLTKGLQVVSWGNEGRLVRGEKTRIALIVENRGIIPIWYFHARILQRQHIRQLHDQGQYIQNQRDQRRVKLVYEGQVKSRKKERCLFEISVGHCGFESFTLDRIFVWDHLRIFKRKLKTDSKEQLVPVFPREYVMQIEAVEGESLLNVGSDNEPIPVPGEDVQEVLQYNAYAPGDSVKNIHWKLSAKGDETWVKKFSRADERRVSLFADLLEDKGMTDEQKDAFYELLQALLLGLMCGGDSVDLYWFVPGSGELQRRIIRDRADVDEAFVALYMAGWMQREKLDEAAFIREKRTKLGDRIIELDGSLRLFSGDLLIKQYTQENYIKELEAGKVVIP